MNTWITGKNLMKLLYHLKKLIIANYMKKILPMKTHVQKVWEVFKIKDMNENYDLYVQSDTLLLADVFENFRDKCIEIYGLDLLIFCQHQD